MNKIENSMTEEKDMIKEMTARIAAILDEYESTPAQNLVVMEHFIAYIIANFLTSNGKGESVEVSIDVVLAKLKDHLVKLVPFMVKDIEQRGYEQG